MLVNMIHNFKQKFIRLIKFVKKDRVLISIIGLGFFIRLAGIWYGLPLQINIDEPALISTTANLNDSLHPGRFDWPHLYFYINALFFGIYGVIRAIISVFVEFEGLYSTSALFVVSRFVHILFATATIVPVYLIARSLFKSRKTALVAALLLAILPVHVDESHFAKLDIPQAFFISWAIYYIVRIFETGERRFFLFVGALIGIATSIKYNGFLVFLPMVIAVLLRFNWADWKNFREWTRIFVSFLLSGLISILFFYLGTPFALLDWNNFWSKEHAVGAMWQFENVGRIDVVDYPLALYETFGKMYLKDLGVSLWFIFTLLMVLFIFFNKRSKPYVLTLLPVLIFCLYISSFERSPSHYFIFLIPLYIPAIAHFILEIRDFLNSRVFKGRLEVITYVALLFVMGSTLYLSAKISYLYSVRDTRNYAYDWIKNNVYEEVDYLYVYGEDLEMVPFQEKKSKRLKRVDVDHVDVSKAPFYLVIGARGVLREEIISGDRDPDLIEGNSSPILKHAELVYEVDNRGRLGPPIYIFYVTNIPTTK